MACAGSHLRTSRPRLYSRLRPILVHGRCGAVLGVLTWLRPVAAALARTDDAGRATLPAQAPRPLALIALAGALFVLFCGWALIRPPFQTPDEPQHHLRMTSILLHPWFAEPNRFELDTRYVSPLATQAAAAD